jgi:hypothetical protein
MSRLALHKLVEPKLRFGLNQALEDPRDGLTLFGPLDEGKTFGVRPAVIGTPAGIRRFWNWVAQIQRPIDEGKFSRPPFPGFEAAFNVPFGQKRLFEVALDEHELIDACHIEDRHQRVHRVVRLYADKIKAAVTDESQADVWFVIVPDEVYASCRPESVIAKDIRTPFETSLGKGIAKKLVAAPSFFEELNDDALPYKYQPHFHNQLKALLLEDEVPTQVIRESTIAPNDFLNPMGYPKRKIGFASEIAWNLCTTAFYKSGARPWKLAEVRSGVCYLGIVFKLDESDPDGRWSSCGAQMFLDSGDGLVFKGAGGPWYSATTNSYHLSEDAARQLMEIAVAEYTLRAGQPPDELFIHGKARFNDEEWRGFRAGIPASTKRLVGVRIRLAEDLRIYRPGRHAVLRTLAYIRDERTAFLWANGFIPRLQTYPGREVPKGLLIDVCRGNADIHTVLNDVLALTKLNYNACIYGDGQPVTLSFADAVGEILTAGPVTGAPTPFKLYI